jgi:DNA invertase Pin-like site-specific DNA recombinase
MRLVTYARVSDTNGDAESIAAQQEVCAAWAQQHGHEIVAVHADDGVSGTLSHAERPGLAAAMLELEEKRADGLIVHRLDRLARQLHVQEAALAHAWDHGARVFEATRGEVLRDDPDDPQRTFMRQVMGAAAELERGMIRARMTGGKRRKAARGGYTGGTRLHRRYGFQLEADGEYVPVPDEQTVIARMRAAREAGESLRGICAQLERDGIAPPAGRQWYPATVRGILSRNP